MSKKLHSVYKKRSAIYNSTPVSSLRGALRQAQGKTSRRSNLSKITTLLKRKKLLLKIASPFRFAMTRVFFWNRLHGNYRLFLNVLIGVLFIVAIPSLYNLFFPSKAEASWFDNNWAYRQAVTLTNNTGSSQTNLQYLLTVDTSTLVTAGKLQITCNDLRFTDVNGKTLPYYIDSGCNSTTTKVWVMLNSIPTATSTIYMYYGNPNAAKGSSSAQFDNLVGLASYYTFNDASSGTSTTVTDASVNANNGTFTTGTATNNWASGKYSNTGNFNGTDNFVSVSGTSTLNNVTVWAWVKSTDNSGNPFNIISGSGIDTYMSMYQNHFQVYDNVAWRDSGVAINDGNWHFVAFTWSQSGSVLTLYVDGVQKYQGNLGTYTNGKLNKIGVYTSGLLRFWPGQIDDVHIYNTTRTATQIANDYKNVYTIQTAGISSQITSSFASEEVGAAPIAYWKFDDGQGTTAKDTSSNGINGTLSGTTKPVWQSADQCIVGKCLYFDGNTSYVTYNNSNSLNIGSGNYTVEAWVKVSALDNNAHIIYGDYGASNNATVLFNMNSNQFQISYRDDNNNIASAVWTTTPTVGKWYHLVGVRSGTTVILYANGVQVASATNASLGTITNSNGTAPSVGRSNLTSAGYFGGLIDDVKVYNYARSSSQVLTDYNSVNSVLGAAVKLGQDPNANLANGLVGYWKMDEATWSGTLNEVLDSSGTGNNLAAQGPTNSKAYPASSSAMFGSAGQFDGVDNYLYSAGNTAFNTSQVTIAAWVKYTGSNASFPDVIDIGGGSNRAIIYVTKSSSALDYRFGSIGGVNYDKSCNYTMDSNWHLVVATYDGKSVNCYVDGVLKNSVSASGSIAFVDNSVFIGNIGSTGSPASSYWGGSIDEARAYNRALSAAEVSQLYNFAPGPVGYWNFDEGQGSTVKDYGATSSATMNNGTVTGTPPFWTQGKIGKGGNFNGTDSMVTVTDNSAFRNIFAYGGTIEAWVYPRSLGQNSFGRIMDKSTGSTAGWSLFSNSISGNTISYAFRQFFSTNFSTWTTPGIQMNKWSHIVIEYNSSSSSNTPTVYINGVASTMSAGGVNGVGTGVSDTNLNFRIGNVNGGGRAYDGKIDDVRIYNYTRTAAQVAQDMNYGHPAGSDGTMLLHYKFDEGYGTTAHDATGLGNDGVLTNMASPPTTGSGWTNNGKIGKALVFDGTNDYVNAGNPTAVKLSGAFTVSAWINLSNNSSAHDIVAKMGASGQFAYRFATNSSGKLVLSVSTDGTNIPTVTGATTLNKFVWYHVVGVYIPGVSETVYINGKQDAQNTSSIPASVFNSTANLNIGGENSGGSNLMNGIIDDVKLYAGILPIEQIRVDYNGGKAVQFGVLGLDPSGNASSSADRMYCPPGDTTGTCGPVGDWEFDEGQSSTVNDITGNGNTGTWNGTGKTHWVSGKVGKAGNFNGSDDYVNVPDSSILDFGTSTSFSYGGWVKIKQPIPASGFQVPFWKGGSSNPTTGYDMEFRNSNKQIFCDVSDGTTSVSSTNVTGAGDGYWHYVECVVDRGANTINIYIDGVKKSTDVSISGEGSVTSSNALRLGNTSAAAFLNGNIDQVRVYNYARSQAQIAWDYNRGAPVAWYKMDECQGTTAHDSSGNGLNGTLTLGSLSSGTCTDGTGTSVWNLGATGKINSSLYFDGSNDYVSFTGNPFMTSVSQLTMSAWVKFSTYASNSNILFNVAGQSLYPRLYYNSSLNQLTDQYSLDGTTKSGGIANFSSKCAVSTWCHIVVTMNTATGGIFYINGKKVATDSNTGTSYNGGTGNMLIGNDTDLNWFMNGQIDDARIYNYALTSQQVQLLYNNNSAVYFGPASGAP